MVRRPGSALFALLALLACGRPEEPLRAWSVEGGEPEARRVALALVEAARTVYAAIPEGGVVHLAPDLTAGCWWQPPPYVLTGCLSDGVWVLYPHPTAGRDVTAGALPHELAHLGGEASEAAANAGAARIVKAYEAGR